MADLRGSLRGSRPPLGNPRSDTGYMVRWITSSRQNLFLYICAKITPISDGDAKSTWKWKKGQDGGRILCALPEFAMLIRICRVTQCAFKRRTIINLHQETVADPGFSRRGCANLLFSQIFPKTTWKWRHFGPAGRVPSAYEFKSTRYQVSNKFIFKWTTGRKVRP